MTIGDVFGQLAVLGTLTSSEAGHPGDGMWCRVRCECGTRKMVRARHLRSGGITSCGCKYKLCVNGLRLSRIEVSLGLGLCPNAVTQRLRMGWPIAVAATARKYFKYKRQHKEQETA